MMLPQHSGLHYRTNVLFWKWQKETKIIVKWGMLRNIIYFWNFSKRMLRTGCCQCWNTQLHWILRMLVTSSQLTPRAHKRNDEKLDEMMKRERPFYSSWSCPPFTFFCSCKSYSHFCEPITGRKLLTGKASKASRGSAQLPLVVVESELFFTAVKKALFHWLHKNEANFSPEFTKAHLAQITRVKMLIPH